MTIGDLHITPFNILMVMFAAFAWTRVLIRFRQKQTSLKWFLFWTLVWLGIGVIIFVPRKTDFVARILGVSKGTDALFTIAIVFLLYTAYRLYAKIDGIERDLSKLARYIALQNPTKNAKPKK